MSGLRTMPRSVERWASLAFLRSLVSPTLARWSWRGRRRRLRRRVLVETCSGSMVTRCRRGRLTRTGIPCITKILFGSAWWRRTSRLFRANELDQWYLSRVNIFNFRNKMKLLAINYCKIAVQSMRPFFFLSSESPRTLSLYIASWKAFAQATKPKSQP